MSSITQVFENTVSKQAYASRDGRTNYFRVKSSSRLLDLANRFGFSVYHNGGDMKLYRLVPHSNADFDGISKMISRNLVDGEVVVFMSTVSEKEHRTNQCQYINGVATAVHSSGRLVKVSLSNIYDMAKSAFGTEVAAAEGV